MKIVSFWLKLHFVFNGPIENTPVLFQIVAWRRRGDKPLSALLMALVIEAYMRGSTSMSNYRQVSNIRRTLEGNKIVDHSDVVGASPVGAAPTTSSFST